MAEEQSSTSNTYKNQPLLENLKDTFLDVDTADVHFAFDSADDCVIRVSAHKILLAASSNVFKRMFYGELKENGDVNMVDVSDAAFKEFLQYFYLSEVKLSADHIAEVMYLGNKYNVKKCVEDCTQFLMDTLSNENVSTALHTGILYDYDELIKACDEVIVVNTDAVFKSVGFLECDKQVLAHILNMDVLSCSEVDVFEACMAWIRSKSKQSALTKALVKKHLDDLYYQIRFASMTMQEFCALETKYSSVLKSDFIAISHVIADPKTESGRFNTSQRYAKWNEAAIVKCNRTLGKEEKSYLIPIEYRTSFSTKKPLLLGSFMCVKVGVAGTYSYDLRSDLAVDVEITEANDLHNTNSKSLLKMRAQLQSTDTEVTLSHPILMRPGFFYNIIIGKFPGGHCYFSKELKTVTWLESSIKIKFHGSHTAANSGKNIGIISSLNFNRI